MDSLAAAPHLVDFDADGDLDLLVGNIAGRIILIRNDGTTKAPKFTKERTVILGGSQPIKVPGGDSGPTTADWDGDGLWDLIVGAGDGSVWLFKNTGEKGKPSFAQGRTLIDKSARGYSPLQPGEVPTQQGSRTKVCVTDYDGDGRLDLLVGDFGTIKKPEPRLTDAQIKEREELRAERTKLSRKLSEIYQKHKDDPKALEKAREPVMKAYSELNAKLQPLEPGQDYYGWVWFFQRKAPATPEGTPSGAR